MHGEQANHLVAPEHMGKMLALLRPRERLRRVRRRGARELEPSVEAPYGRQVAVNRRTLVARGVELAQICTQLPQRDVQRVDALTLAPAQVCLQVAAVRAHRVFRAALFQRERLQVSVDERLRVGSARGLGALRFLGRLPGAARRPREHGAASHASLPEGPPRAAWPHRRRARRSPCAHRPHTDRASSEWAGPRGRIRRSSRAWAGTSACRDSLRAR